MRDEKIVRSGFTLIEVLFSALIIALAASSFTLVFSKALSYIENVNMASSAIMNIQMQMEGLRARSFNELSLTDEISFDNGKGRIKIFKMSGDLLRIDASYRYEADRNPIAISTLRSRY